MSHFAKIENSLVTGVIVAEQSFVDTLTGKWVKTSYNTRGGIHYGPDGTPDDAEALRANFAGIGFTYDKTRDVFYAPKPSPLHELDLTSYLWKLKPEYTPLAIVKVTSMVKTIPTLAANSDINGITLTDKNLVFFPSVANPGVFKYSAELGLLPFADYEPAAVKTVGDDTQIWKLADGIWVAHPVS